MSSEAPVSAPSRVPVAPWLRDPPFDLTFIGATAAWAIGAGAAVVLNPQLFLPILALDVWLLGYQHVVATFTRLVFDSESLRAHRALVIELPVIVAVCTIAVAWLVGPWIIATLYLYWQWFHYTRQSFGVSRMYLRKAQRTLPANDVATFGVIYLLPLWGILRRSHQHPARFLGLDIVCLPVPTPVLYVSAALALASVVLWVAREARLWSLGQQNSPYACYVLSHMAVFTAGYLLIDDINTGWLVLNIWHNAQYVLVVWMYNSNRFRRGVDPGHRFLSTISQQNNIALYFAVCVGLATVLYLSIQQGLSIFAGKVMGASLTAYMIINFHHYVVDAIVWRSRRSAASQRVAA